MIEEPIEEPLNADPTFQPLIDAERAAAADAAEDNKGRGVLRFYELAKKQEWQVRDMPWGEIPPIPETRMGASPERKERRQVEQLAGHHHRELVGLELLGDHRAPHSLPALLALGRGSGPRLGDRRDLAPRQVAHLPLLLLRELVEAEDAASLLVVRSV
ncbi:MAG: hypothetical protein ACXWZP_04295, partial [Gaiellaceae bacterium]